MLLFTGSNHEIFNSLLNALEEVSRDDPLHDYEHKPFLDHKDGWGFIDSGRDFLSYSRSIEPVFQSGEKNFSGDIRIIHARNATEGEPFSLTSTQPFHLPLDTHDIYFAHNGWLDKQKLGSGFSVEFMETRSDSEILLRLMSTFSGNPLERFRGALEQVYRTDCLVSGLNIFMLAVDRSTQAREVFVYSDARHFDLYHQFFYLKGEGYSAVASSSLPESGHFPAREERAALYPGVIYSVNNNRCIALERVQGCPNAPDEHTILLK